MKKVFIISAIATMTMMACNNSSTETEDTIITPVEEHECATPAVFDSTITYTLTGLNGTAIDCEGRCTICFNGESGEFHGISFVNSFFGTFKATPCGKMMFDHTGMTEMMGDEKCDKLEQEFHAALNTVNRYELTDNGISLKQDDKTVLEFSIIK